MEPTDHAKPDERAVTAPRRKTTVSWSAAVDKRLDQLTFLATTTEPDRSDLLAAIVAAAPADGSKLDALVAQWRKRTIREVVLDVSASAKTIPLPRNSPGRRRRAAN